MSIGRAFAVSVLMSLVFMVATAYQSAATLMNRVASTDVMKAAVGVAWIGPIGRQVAYFVLAQVVLHVAFAAVVWVVACSTIVLRPGLRPRLVQIAVLWFCAFALAVIAYNAFWFPRTGLGAYYHDAMSVTVGSLAVGRLIYSVILAVATLIIAAGFLIRVRGGWVARSGRLRAAAIGIGALGVATVLFARDLMGDQSAVMSSRPHVIVLGIDSLRLEQLERFGGLGMTPNLDRFLQAADIVRDTTTPAARTFSSWAAILTGRSPTVTGVRFNLAERTSLRVSPTIADVLRTAGYHTVYSTDEVRFANIDQSFGFDQVITPPIGAADFLIGTYNELPLATVVVNSRLGQVLFPFSYGNRGVATVFQPQSYLARLEHELSFEQPTLLVTHLTASHWPYYVSDTPFSASQPMHPEDRPLYRSGLRTVDAMFGSVVATLERKGALENAIVIVLSDHGEALSLPMDSIFADGSIIEGLRAPLPIVDAGHGQSVLSPVQYQVLLGFRSFGKAAGFDTSGRDFVGGSTVEDIAPTILDLLQLPGDPLSATGRSIGPLLRGEMSGDRIASPDRVRFTETDLKVLPLPDGSVDEVGTAKNNSKFFEVDPASGRLHIRRRFAPLALAFKERAAFDERQLLAAIPAGPNAHQYIYVDKFRRQGRLLLGRPGDDEPDAQRLWDALWEHYAGELMPAMSVTREDWPAIDEAWAQFPLAPQSAPDHLSGSRS